MMNLRDFYVLGLPIDTELGKVNFIKVREYPRYFMDFQSIKMSKAEILYRYHQINEDGKFNDLIKHLKGMSLYEMSISLPDLKASYLKVFYRVFDDKDDVDYITKDNFDFYRKLILDMNCIKEDKINPNPEIQKHIERSKRVKANEGGKLTFGDICSSIVGYNGLSYDDILDFTIYQFYLTFNRISQIKNHDTSTLFATVSNEVKVESWSKHIDLYEEEKHTVSKDEFMKTTGDVLNN